MYLEYRKAYERERGTRINPVNGEHYPKTTWGDVITFYSAFLKATNDTRSCLTEEMSKEFKWSPTNVLIAIGTPNFQTQRALDSCLAYLKSSRFKQARDKWIQISPLNRAAEKWGSSAPFEVASAILRGDEYIDNWFFWDYGKRYAIARSAAGKVKGSFDILVESLDEAIEDLPSTIKNAMPDPGKWLPDVSPWVELIKWGSVFGGLGLLYWYVLRPQK